MALIDKLKAIANAIRQKTGSTELITLDAMPELIASISGGSSGSGLGDSGDRFTTEFTFTNGMNGELVNLNGRKPKVIFVTDLYGYYSGTVRKVVCGTWQFWEGTYKAYTYVFSTNGYALTNTMYTDLKNIVLEDESVQYQGDFSYRLVYINNDKLFISTKADATYTFMEGHTYRVDVIFQ